MLTTCALVLGGCAHTREVTPWLRTTRVIPFRLLAESGHPEDVDKVRAERLEGGRWVELPDLGDQAFGLAGGTRAVIDDALVPPEGLGRIRQDSTGSPNP